MPFAGVGMQVRDDRDRGRVPISVCFLAVPRRTASFWLDLTGDRLRLDRLAATEGTVFFPPPAALHRETKKAALSILRSAAAASGASPIVSGTSSPSRPRRTRIEARRSNMATIGTFTATDDGFTGTLATLTLKAKVKIVRVQKDSEKAPDARVYAGTTDYA